MAANTTLAGRISPSCLTQLLAWWGRIRRQQKIAGAASVFVLCGLVYVCSFLATYIEQAFANKAAASTALYMDSFVEPLVQSLGQSPSLPPDTRGALERLLSPASIGKPVVTFRIWVRDRIAFSNRGELIDRTFPPSPARVSARQGEVVATFGLDSDDDEYERSLGVPILETYAPIRKAGTHEIIAVAEIAELASELASHMRAAQYTSYAIVVSLAAAVLLALFGLGSERDPRAERAIETEALARLSAASGRALECSDRDRRSLCEELHSGPLQQAAFALLRVDGLRKAGDRRDEEIEIISKALETCVTQLRSLSGRLPPELNDVPLSSALEIAISRKALQTEKRVKSDLFELPHDLPHALKACVFQFLEEGLSEACKCARDPEVQVCAKARKAGFEIEVRYETTPDLVDRVLADQTRRSQNLKHRVEALRGELSFRPVPPNGLSITARFVLPNESGGSA